MAWPRKPIPIPAQLPVLTYHSLDDSGSVISIAPADFRWQMEHLRQLGWQTLNLAQMLAGLAEGRWPARRFVLTFDDGFDNFAEHALPVLPRCGYSAIVFVTTDWVGHTNEWPGQIWQVPRLPLMSWDRLAAIVTAGMEVGAHSTSHADLAHLAQADQQREVAASRDAIAARLGRAPGAFAYPYGRTAPGLLGLVARHFQAAFTTRLGYVTRHSRPPALERVDMYYLQSRPLFRVFAAGRLAPYLTLRRWLRALRPVAGGQPVIRTTA